MARQGKKVKFTTKDAKKIAAMRKKTKDPTYQFDGKTFYERKPS